MLFLTQGNVVVTYKDGKAHKSSSAFLFTHTMTKFYLKTLLFCLLSLVGINVSAIDRNEYQGGIYYNVDLNLTNPTATVTYGALKYTGKIIIPSQIDVQWVVNRVPAIIHVKVVAIGDSAFYDCNDLTSVTIPESVTSIGKHSFNGCSKLSSVTIPKSITSVGKDAFRECTKLYSVIVEDIAAWCMIKFENTSSNPLYYAHRLSDTRTEEIRELTIPEGVTSISNYAFYNYNHLTSVDIPSSVTSIGTSAFSGCTQLKDVTINSNTIVSQTYTSSFNLTNIFGSQVTNYKIGNSVTSIGNYAFYLCKGLTSVTFPNSVTSIGGDAFYGCSGLTSVTFPNSVTSIGGFAFYGCSGLTSVTFPNSVTSIGVRAFSGCSGLPSVTFPDSVTSIGDYAFCGCSGFTSLIIPENVRSVGSRTFEDYCTLQVKRGTNSLLALWKAGYEPCELGTTNTLVKPTLNAVSSATQSTIKIKAEPVYNEYKYYVYNESKYKAIADEELLLTGLYPESSNRVSLYISIGDINSDPQPFNIILTYDFTTAPISPTFNETATSSSVRAIGSFINGDANVTSQSISIYKGYNTTGNKIETIDGNKVSMTGLDPNSPYTFEYSIVANNKKYTTKKSVQTSGLSLTTSQPKVVSLGNVIVAAETNLDNEETNVGFEWRRTDWTDDFASNTGGAYLYEGTMEGYIRNLYTEKLWKYRPYYLSNSGTYYYGDWVGLDPTNTSYFEPTVHTYASINIEGNTALVKGYALTGSDKITVQGFKYWKSVAGAKERDEVNRIASVPSDAMTVEASGQVMTANLTGLDYNSTYHYVAFVTTSEGETYYGEEQVFETGDNLTGIESVEAEPTEQKPVTVVARYNMNGQQISSPQKGINILRMSDGIVKKVLVK